MKILFTDRVTVVRFSAACLIVLWGAAETFAADAKAKPPIDNAQGRPIDIAQGRQAAGKNPIDGMRAFRYLEQLCELGPRPSGSAAMKEQQRIVREHFAKL